MYNLGIENKLINSNPVKAVKKLREENYKIRYLTAEEETRMYKAIDNNFPYLKPIIVCALQTGMGVNGFWRFNVKLLHLL